MSLSRISSLASALGGVRIKKLRKWKDADAGWMRELDNACFPTDTSFYNDEDYHWWVVYIDKVPVAYAAARVHSRSGDDKRIVCIKFSRCGVLPEYRGHGFQRALIAARVSWAKRVRASRIETYTSLDNQHSKNNLIAEGFRYRRRGQWFRYRLDLEKR